MVPAGFILRKRCWFIPISSFFTCPQVSLGNPIFLASDWNHPPIRNGLGGHIFCHFSPQNAYFQNKRHTGRNFSSSCWLLRSQHETTGTLAPILGLWDAMLRATQAVWQDEENSELKLTELSACSPQNLLCEIKHFYHCLNWLGMKFSVTVSCMHLKSSTIFNMFMKNR